MNYRMPFWVPFLPKVLTAAFAGGISIWIVNLLTSDRILETQTHFAIRQAIEKIEQIDEADFPLTAADLIDYLRSSRIDWNSCGIRKDQILDGWGHPIRISFDSANKIWSFHSSGKDGKSGTADDIRAATTANRRDEDARGNRK